MALDTKLEKFSYKSKEVVTLPKGTTIISKNVNVNIEEIENGYLICKSVDICYKLKGSEHSDYKYYTKKWFSKDNPIEIDSKDKELADIFDDSKEEY